MMSSRRLAICLLLLTGCATHQDLLIVNAQLPGRAVPTTVLVRDGTIAALGGPVDDVAAARRLDARGGLVLPGFHDAHVHLMDGGIALTQLDLSGLETPEAVAEAVRRWAAQHPDQPAIRGRGWDYGIVPKGQFPHRRVLDAAVADRPVLLEAYDGHAWWLSSAALKRANITANTVPPEGGRVVLGPDGGPGGVILEAEAWMLARLAMPLSRAEQEAGVVAGLTHLRRLGVTSADAIVRDPVEIEILRALAADDALPLRVHVCPLLGGDLDGYDALRRELTGARLGFGPLKGFVDGVIESQTALMVEPFAGSHEHGHAMMPAKELNEQVVAAQCRGFGVALHAVGDGAVRMALDAFAEAERACGARSGPRRIEHIEVLHPDDLPRFAALRVVASMQPYHAHPGGANPDEGAWARNLGPERLKRSFPWRDLLDAGAVLAFGSDWPVLTADPLHGLAVALTRQTRDGLPEGGWNAHQTVTADEALRAYRLEAARGRPPAPLTVGARADLVILSPDAALDQPESLWDARVVHTLVGGR